jgi:hypothetical protein
VSGLAGLVSGTKFSMGGLGVKAERAMRFAPATVMHVRAACFA